MSQENVEIVRAAFAAFERGDVQSLLDVCDESVEITQAAEFFDSARRQHGHSGVLEALAIWPEQWDDYHIEVVRLDDFGDRVLAVTTNRGRGKGSGVQVESPFTFLFTLRDGKLTEWRFFQQEEQALKAIELEE